MCLYLKLKYIYFYLHNFLSEIATMICLGHCVVALLLYVGFVTAGAGLYLPQQGRKTHLVSHRNPRVSQTLYSYNNNLENFYRWSDIYQTGLWVTPRLVPEIQPNVIVSCCIFLLRYVKEKVFKATPDTIIISMLLCNLSRK